MLLWSATARQRAFCFSSCLHLLHSTFAPEFRALLLSVQLSSQTSESWVGHIWWTLLLATAEDPCISHPFRYAEADTPQESQSMLWRVWTVWSELCPHPLFSSGKKECSCKGFSAFPDGLTTLTPLLQLLLCHQQTALLKKLGISSQWIWMELWGLGAPSLCFFLPSTACPVCVLQVWGWHHPLDPMQWDSGEVCSFSCHWSDRGPLLHLPSPSSEQSWC